MDFISLFFKTVEYSGLSNSIYFSKVKVPFKEFQVRISCALLPCQSPSTETLMIPGLSSSNTPAVAALSLLILLELSEVKSVCLVCLILVMSPQEGCFLSEQASISVDSMFFILSITFATKGCFSPFSLECNKAWLWVCLLMLRGVYNETSLPLSIIEYEFLLPKSEKSLFRSSNSTSSCSIKSFTKEFRLFS